MSTAAGPDGERRDFWQRSRVGWHATFAVLLGLVAVLLLLDAGLDTGRRVLGVGLLAVLGLAYLLVGRVALGADRLVLGLAYLGPAWACFLGLVLVDDEAFLLLLALIPQSWAMLPTRRAAVVWNVSTVAAVVVLQLARGGSPGAALTFGLTNLALTLLLGLWIWGVIEESGRRAELIVELQRTRAELAETERARGVLAERARLAREIHDTLAQGFTSVLTLAQAVEVGLDRDPDAARARLRLLEDVARDNLAEARRVVAALGPVDLEGSTVAEAITRIAHRFSAETGIPVSVEVHGDADAPATRRSANAEVVLLRAAQEALANVRRHSGASTVRLRLDLTPERAELVVVDDGRGFAPQPAASVTSTAPGPPGPAGPSRGFGLDGMRSRASQVGGAVEVTSAPGRGTTVRVRVP